MSRKGRFAEAESRFMLPGQMGTKIVVKVVQLCHLIKLLFLFLKTCLFSLSYKYKK